MLAKQSNLSRISVTGY